MEEKKEKELKSLVAVDGSEVSKKAVVLSARFAAKTGVHLTLLHVLEDVVRYDKVPETWKYYLREQQAKKILEEAKKLAEENGAKSVDTKIAVGPVAEEIVRIAEEGGYVSIIIGTKGRSPLKKLLLGSVAEKVVLYAHCPVVVVR